MQKNIFSCREITKPKTKLFGVSESKKQIIERDGNIYRVWDALIKNRYFFFYCYKSEEKYKLKLFKNIKY